MANSIAKPVTKKGTWMPEEDAILYAHVSASGHSNWRLVALNCGLSKSGKSCRLRWNELQTAGVKRRDFTPQEKEIIVSMQKEHGNRWSLIAKCLPGRTDYEIKNYWNTYLKPRNDPCKKRKEAKLKKHVLQILESSQVESLQPVLPLSTPLESPDFPSYPQGEESESQVGQSDENREKESYTPSASGPKDVGLDDNQHVLEDDGSFWDNLPSIKLDAVHSSLWDQLDATENGDHLENNVNDLLPLPTPTMSTDFLIDDNANDLLQLPIPMMSPDYLIDEELQYVSSMLDPCWAASTEFDNVELNYEPNTSEDKSEAVDCEEHWSYWRLPLPDVINDLEQGMSKMGVS